MFLEQQVRILDSFLKEHGTLRTGVMMLKIQLCITGINYTLKYAEVHKDFAECKALNTLHNFRLSQTKDWHRETIVAISVIVAPNWWFCVVQWERFKDGRCHSLATKDSLQYSMIIAQCICCYHPRLLTNQ